MSLNKFTSKRAPFYANVPDEKWNDWRWQMANRLNSVEDFEKILKPLQKVRKKHSAPTACFGLISHLTLHP